MSQSDINPYRPVELGQTDIDFDPAEEVAFRITASRLRHAESHLLLRVHLRRLLYSCLFLIFASGVAMVWSARLGVGPYLISAIASLSVSTLVYLALVHRSKMGIRHQMHSHGLRQGSVCSVAAVDDSLTLTTPTGQFHWPRNALSTYRAPGGLLINPEPMLPIFVPRRNDSGDHAYEKLRELTSKESP